MRQYYDRRVREYEQIYTRADPIRQSELTQLAAVLRAALGGRRVLEVACGTGYWTSIIAEVAERVVATDISAPMLAAARQKRLPADKVELRLADAYALHAVPGTFDAAVAVFWLSHVPKVRMAEFLTQFHARLGPGATVVFADNVFVRGVGGELVSRAGGADTFKRRTLTDGSKYEVLKNYHGEDELGELLKPWATELKVHFGRCFWWLSYVTVRRPD